MEHFAQVVEQIDNKIAAIKLDIKETELHLHEQLLKYKNDQQYRLSDTHRTTYQNLLRKKEGTKLTKSSVVPSLISLRYLNIQKLNRGYSYL